MPAGLPWDLTKQPIFYSMKLSIYIYGLKSILQYSSVDIYVL